MTKKEKQSVDAAVQANGLGDCLVLKALICGLPDACRVMNDEELTQSIPSKRKAFC
jgi:hypothetical protein